MNNLNELRYGLYARKSNESEDKQIASLDDQVNAMKEIAKREGYHIIKQAIFKESKSAKIPYKRKKFDELIEMLENGTINGILIYKSNRLSRNPIESGIVQQMLFDRKIKAIVATDKRYLPDDNAIYFSLDAAQDTQFSRELSVTVKRGMHSKAKRGVFPGKVPIGYRNVRESIDSNVRIVVIDDERFPIVRRMWDYMLTGQYSVSEIARIADKEWGLKTRKTKKRGGTALSVSGVYAMFQKPFYMGVVKYSDIHNVDGTHTPMVTPEEFQRVQSLIRRKDAPRPSEETAKNDPFPYRGLVRCGKCGCLITYMKMVKKRKNGNVHTYEYCYCTQKRECSQKMTVSKMTPQEMTKAIRKEISKYTIMDEFFQWTCQYLDEFHEDEANKREAILNTQMKSIRAIERDINDLQRALYRGKVDDAFYKTEKQELDDRLITLRGQFEDQQNANKRQRQLLEKYFNFARYAKEDFESDDDLKKKEVLSIIGQNLLMQDGKLVFEPIKYLTPLVEKYPKLEEQFKRVQTTPDKRKKDAFASLIQLWYTTDSKVYTQLKQEGRRWREILDPMYREYKLQIRGRD